jgi:AcrR family transcriptional regulator
MLYNAVSVRLSTVARPKLHDDDLRVRLIETAAALLAVEGPHALSTRRVASEAGTSTTAIYSLLGSKHDLVRAMYLEGFTRLEARLATVPTTSDPAGDTASLGHAYLDNALANPNLYNVMFSHPVAEFRPSEEDAAFALTTLQTLIDAVQRAVDAGQFAGDAHVLGLRLWALVHGVAHLAINGMLGSPADAHDHVTALNDAVHAGLAPA